MLSGELPAFLLVLTLNTAAQLQNACADQI